MIGISFPVEMEVLLFTSFSDSSGAQADPPSAVPLPHSLLEVVEMQEIPTACTANTLDALVKALSAGQHVQVLSECAIISEYHRKLASSQQEATVFLDELLSRLSEPVSANQRTVSLYLLALGAACLASVVQANYVGANVGLAKLDCEVVSKCGEQAAAMLALDGVPVVESIKVPSLLVLAGSLLSHPLVLQSGLATGPAWQVRWAFAYQSLLLERAGSLLDKLGNNPVLASAARHVEGGDAEADLDVLSVMSNDLDKEAVQLMLVEASRLCSLFWDHERAKVLLRSAMLLAGIRVDFTGVKGKRTRYQQEDLSQLFLKVEGCEGRELVQTSEDCPPPKGHPQVLPKDLALGDDTVLDQIQVEGGGIPEEVLLSPLEQCMLLASCEVRQATRRAEEAIKREEIEAYVRYVLQRKQCWSVTAKALLMRSQNETWSSRRIERSMLQLEELAGGARGDGSDGVSSDGRDKLGLVFASGLLPPWRIEAELAYIQVSCGAVSSALEIFERLGLWADVISCAQKTGRTGKAEAVIRRELTKKETAYLYCCLGEATGDPAHYRTAWELSKGRSFMAMARLGMDHLRRNEFKEAVECLSKSLDISGLQAPIWFSCGCAALASEQYQLAVKCFRRCVTLDYDNFEAWSNLAAAYRKTNQISKAFNVLQESLKCAYENWRVWENYLIVSLECGEIEEGLRAASRMCDLKPKWCDDQSLGLIARAVLEDRPRRRPQAGARLTKAGGSSALRSGLLELYGRVEGSGAASANAGLWCQYGLLLLAPGPEGTASAEHLTKGLQCLLKCYRCLTQKASWEKDEKLCRSVCSESQRIGEAHLAVYESTNTKALLSTARLHVKGTLARLKQVDVSSEELIGGISKLESLLQAIQDKLGSHADLSA